MKFFVIFACAFAAASAGIVAPVAPIHLPVIGPNGVPVDTAEVQYARASHAVYKANAFARNGDIAVVAPTVAHSAVVAPVGAHHAYAVAPIVAHSAYAHPFLTHHLVRRGLLAAAPVSVVHAIPAAYPTTLGVPAVAADGTPLETPEVVAAKSDHFAAHAEALARNSPIVAPVGAPVVAPAAVATPVVVASSPQHLPIIDSTGVPVDTVEVQHARAAHAVHKAEAHARNSDVVAVAAPVVAHHTVATPVISHHVVGAPVVAHSAVSHSSYVANPVSIHHLARRGLYTASPIAIAHAIPAAYPTTHGVPVVTADGTPLETPEVAAAKANHFAAHAQALTRNSPIVSNFDLVAPVAAPVAVIHGIPAAYLTTQGVPAVTADGTPLETPEVLAAKSNHFAAHAQALARNNPIVSHVVAPVASL